jgi:hypothetical protein
MSIRGRWRVVETPNYDMAAAGAYILFDEDGGEFAFDWQGNGSRLHREALPYFFNSLLSDAIASATENASEALDLLEAGRDYLHVHPDVAECPLCGSNERISGLADAIGERLQALTSLKAADAAKEKQQSALSSAEAALTHAEADCRKASAAFDVAQALPARCDRLTTATAALARRRSV